MNKNLNSGVQLVAALKLKSSINIHYANAISEIITIMDLTLIERKRGRLESFFKIYSNIRKFIIIAQA